MHVSLTPEWQAFVQHELSSGLFKNADEVICAGLRRLKADQDTHLPQLPDTLEELERQLLEAAQSIDEDGGVSADETFASLWQRIAERRRDA